MKTPTAFVWSLLLAALPATASLAADTAHQPMQVAESQAQPAAQRAEGVWIDVRTAKEFSQGHLEGAYNIPVDRIAREIAEISPDKDAPINLYCRSGRRAEDARKQLQAMGYTNVTNHGGYQDLLKKGVR